MAPYSEKSKNWREEQKFQIKEWQNKVQGLRNLANLENWHSKRLDIEIAQLLDADLRIIWDFASTYITQYKNTSFSNFMADAMKEIRTYGVVEPGRKMHLLKAIETAKRKIKYGNRKKS